MVKQSCGLIPYVTYIRGAQEEYERGSSTAGAPISVDREEDNWHLGEVRRSPVSMELMSPRPQGRNRVDLARIINGDGDWSWRES